MTESIIALSVSIIGDLFKQLFEFINTAFIDATTSSLEKNGAIILVQFYDVYTILFPYLEEILRGKWSVCLELQF